MAYVKNDSVNVKSRWVQTTLTSAFSSPKTMGKSKETITPYLTKPIPSHGYRAGTIEHADTTTQAPTIAQGVNLHAERRANLPRVPIESPGSSSSQLITTHSSSLAVIAAETKTILPSLLAVLPSATPSGILYGPAQSRCLRPLHQSRCPHFPPSPVRVLNADSLDSALAFPPSANDSKPVLILNMANGLHGGGGWLKGALAQEESLCYRSSLSFTLKRRFYPLGNEEVIYSPRVVVIRESLAKGHALLDLSCPQDLPIVSVLSVAAARDPDVMLRAGREERYKFAQDESLMGEKMRSVLRVARRAGHRRLVLGALGCGAFGNPRGEVARLWKEVLKEKEFEGWWEGVIFAVLEDGGTRDGMGNFGVFSRALDGMML
ncbi:hypothetical protein MMC13_004546 [Lambiella insularis]|nr:hypothetical protein [Lambiella insularis]